MNAGRGALWSGLLAAVAVAAACLVTHAARPQGSRCAADDECAAGLICRYGRCRQACSFDRDCPEGSLCVEVAGSPAERVCTTEGEAVCPTCVPEAGLECSRDFDDCRELCGEGLRPGESCGPGRRCVGDACVDWGVCLQDDDCRLGCRCRDRACVLAEGLEAAGGDYCLLGPSPTEIGPADGDELLEVETLADELDCEGEACCAAESRGALSLREALVCAGARRGPHRITFRVGLRGGTIELGPSSLPPVPSLTYLDGGGEAPITLAGRGEAGVAGLRLLGAGIAVSDFRVVGFDGDGVVVSDGSEDVHLFRMRVGHAANGESVGNANGVVVVGARRVWIGRGRELEGLEPRIRALAPRFEAIDVTGYDINVVVANRGDGIRVSGSEQVSISGTWVGLSNAGGRCEPCGNDGTGIVLDDVRAATVGGQALFSGERRGLASYHAPTGGEMTGDDPFPEFVSVGRNGGGGVLVIGGGEISMPGLVVGNTPVWVADFEQNQGFGVRVESNEARVVVGAPDELRGERAFAYAAVWTRSAVPVQVFDNRAEVTLRGLHVMSYEASPEVAVDVSAPRAPIAVEHVTAFGTFGVGIVRVLGASGVPVRVVNSLFIDINRAEPAESRAVLILDPAAASRAEPSIEHVATGGIGTWCTPDCPLSVPGGQLLATFDCDLPERIGSVDPACPQVDAGADLGLDRTVFHDGDFVGCGPDLGSVECTSEACLAVTCP